MLFCLESAAALIIALNSSAQQQILESVESALSRWSHHMESLGLIHFTVFRIYSLHETNEKSLSLLTRNLSRGMVLDRLV